jgi:Zn-dependent M28 family amino/carboxypeptidase
VGIPVVEVHDVKWAKRLAKSAKKGRAANLATEIVAQQITAPNVGAWLDRGKPRTIVIGAHYDHVGLGAWGSRKPELAGQVHNGADDNASGTSVLLTLAQMLAKVPSLGDANLAFVAFTGEESGLLGSKEFVETIPAPLGKVTTMLNLDMVGRLNRSDSLRVYGVHTAPEFQQMLETIPADGFYWDLRNEIFGRSDHAPFIQKGIPAVFFFTGLHEDYHAPGDDLEKIDLDGMAAVTEAAAAFIQLLANNAPPTFNPESSKD